MAYSAGSVVIPVKFVLDRSSLDNVVRESQGALKSASTVSQSGGFASGVVSGTVTSGTVASGQGLFSGKPFTSASAVPPGSAFSAVSAIPPGTPLSSALPPVSPATGSSFSPKSLASYLNVFTESGSGVGLAGAGGTFSSPAVVGATIEARYLAALARSDLRDPMEQVKSLMESAEAIRNASRNLPFELDEKTRSKLQTKLDAAAKSLQTSGLLMEQNLLNKASQRSLQMSRLTAEEQAAVIERAGSYRSQFGFEPEKAFSAALQDIRKEKAESVRTMRESVRFDAAMHGLTDQQRAAVVGRVQELVAGGLDRATAMRLATQEYRTQSRLESSTLRQSIRENLKLADLPEEYRQRVQGRTQELQSQGLDRVSAFNAALAEATRSLKMLSDAAKSRQRAEAEARARARQYAVDKALGGLPESARSEVIRRAKERSEASGEDYTRSVRAEAAEYRTRQTNLARYTEGLSSGQAARLVAEAQGLMASGVAPGVAYNLAANRVVGSSRIQPFGGGFMGGVKSTMKTFLQRPSGIGLYMNALFGGYEVLAALNARNSMAANLARTDKAADALDAMASGLESMSSGFFGSIAGFVTGTHKEIESLRAQAAGQRALDKAKNYGDQLIRMRKAYSTGGESEDLYASIRARRFDLEKELSERREKILTQLANVKSAAEMSGGDYAPLLAGLNRELSASDALAREQREMLRRTENKELRKLFYNREADRIERQARRSAANAEGLGYDEIDIEELKYGFQYAAGLRRLAGDFDSDEAMRNSPEFRAYQDEMSAVRAELDARRRRLTVERNREIASRRAYSADMGRAMFRYATNNLSAYGLAREQLDIESNAALMALNPLSSTYWYDAERIALDRRDRLARLEADRSRSDLSMLYSYGVAQDMLNRRMSAVTSGRSMPASVSEALNLLSDTLLGLRRMGEEGVSPEVRKKFAELNIGQLDLIRATQASSLSAVGAPGFGVSYAGENTAKLSDVIKELGSIREEIRRAADSIVAN